MISKLIKIIPLTYSWFLNKLFSDDIETVLDLACGDGRLLLSILGSNHNYKITGLDLDVVYLRKAKETGIYERLLQVDLSKAKWPGVDSKKYDLVFCSQVIEHLDRKSGEKLLSKVESLANKKIYVGTVRGSVAFKPYDGEGENVPHQQHKSKWIVEDFTKRDYRVYGQALPFVFSDNSFVRKFPKPFRFVFFVISYLASPFLYFFPNKSHTILAVKYKS